MKIALIVRYYNKHQGIPHDVAELAERFVQRGHEVHVFTQTWQDVGDERIVFHRVPGIAKRHFSNELFFFFLSGLLLRRHSFDVVNYHDPCFHRGGVFTCHAFPRAGIGIMERIGRRAETGIPTSFSRPFKLLYPISDYNMKNPTTERIISVSHFLTKEMESLLGVDHSRLTVVPNGVDLERFNRSRIAVERPALMRRHQIGEHDFVVLFVGYYHLRKGLQFLVRALSRVERVRISVLVVGRDAGAEPYVRDLARRHAGAHRVIFAGDAREVHRYFSVGHVLALPTLYEPFGNVVLEAMACGVAPLVSRMAGAADLVEDGHNGVLIDDPVDTEELGAKLNLLAGDRHRLRRLSANAAETASGYDWDAIADKTLTVYRDAINERGESDVN